MLARAEKGNRLTTWKEIANYLNCSVRSCRRWEKTHGLPVYRIDKESKTTVYAFCNELDLWLTQKAKKKKPLKEISGFWIKSNRILIFGFISVSLILSVFVLSKIFLDRNPYDFEIKNSILYILNKNGKKLWDFETGVENLLGNEHYKKRFQVKTRRNNTESFLPHIIIRDITNDKKPEILFSIQTQDEFGEGKLFCFDSKRKKLWDFEAGKELIFGDKLFSKDYRIFGFDVHDLFGDGKLEVIILSSHRHDFPGQMIILNSEGKKLGEYWNSGFFSDLQFIDLDKNGRTEILVSGCNNEYGKGCLIVFDPTNVRGCSPQNDNTFSCAEIEPGTEMYYMLFPRTDLDLLEAEVETISVIDVLQNKNLSLITLTGKIIFELDMGFDLKKITFSNQFKRKHRLARLEGKIKGELDQEYIENLKKELLYYDGKYWVSNPTMTSYWKNKVSSN